eukprot:TRINITY_DN92550_c0_g1_i1.p1 TRINITY_DN92550_c0_g1~~TRINITY_DN92550_c0_g1_i1.p1  ORF type:complete len:337 (+),score=45.47 TRINITY_DN92550_c0_g1_i1:147-1013(+)
MAPRFWRGLNEFADYSQMVNGFRKVKDALFFLADNYDKLGSISARVDRVEELRRFAICERSTGKIAFTGQTRDALLEVKDVVVAVPSSIWGPAKVLGSSGVSFTLHQGDTLLLQGESGVGKSSLLRVVAGIWENGSGTVARTNNVFFLPQTPYIPTGETSPATTLRFQLSYPDEDIAANASLLAALDVVKLRHFSDQLDDPKDWNMMLSGGEKQRLVFARLLVLLRLQGSGAPVVLLDEATAALSEQAEEEIYAALLQQVSAQHGAIVTVGHRSSLRKFHKEFLTLRS